MTPTIHITNWSSRKLHGPGRKWTIMAKPRAWERGEGRVDSLTPRVEDLASVMAKEIDVAEYKRRFLEHVLAWHLAANEANPGLHHHLGPEQYPLRIGLSAIEWGNPDWRCMVRDGDTLCCACSKAAAVRGECHRVWAAELLRAAGWRVILDGKELP